jgi:hypothetical protein
VPDAGGPLPQEFPNLSVPRQASIVGQHVNDEWRKIRAAVPSLPAQVGNDWLDLMLLSWFLPEPGDLSLYDTHEYRENNQFMARWSASGGPNFALTHGLTTGLLLTDCSGLLASDVQWPFDELMVTLPHPGSPLAFTGMDNQSVLEARWLTAHRYLIPASEAEQEVLVMKATTLREELRDKPGTAAVVRRMVEGMNDCRKNVTRWKHRTVVRLFSESHATIFQADRWPQAGEAVEPWLKCPQPEKYGHPGRAPSRSLGRGLDLAALQAATRLVCNLCVYVNTQRRKGRLGDVRATSPKTDRHGKWEPKTWQLGSEVKLPGPLRDAARAFCQSGGGSGRWKIASRFSVRGHYHAYLYGKGRTERRLKWVQPYMKGPEDGPAISERTYEVDEKEKKADQ